MQVSYQDNLNDAPSLGRLLDDNCRTIMVRATDDEASNNEWGGWVQVDDDSVDCIAQLKALSAPVPPIKNEVCCNHSSSVSYDTESMSTMSFHDTEVRRLADKDAPLPKRTTNRKNQRGDRSNVSTDRQAISPTRSPTRARRGRDVHFALDTPAFTPDYLQQIPRKEVRRGKDSASINSSQNLTESPKVESHHTSTSKTEESKSPVIVDKTDIFFDRMETAKRPRFYKGKKRGPIPRKPSMMSLSSIPALPLVPEAPES